MAIPLGVDSGANDGLAVAASHANDVSAFAASRANDGLAVAASGLTGGQGARNADLAEQRMAFALAAESFCAHGNLEVDFDRADFRRGWEVKP